MSCRVSRWAVGIDTSSSTIAPRKCGLAGCDANNRSATFRMSCQRGAQCSSLFQTWGRWNRGTTSLSTWLKMLPILSGFAFTGRLPEVRCSWEQSPRFRHRFNRSIQTLSVIPSALRLRLAPGFLRLGPLRNLVRPPLLRGPLLVQFQEQGQYLVAKGIRPAVAPRLLLLASGGRLVLVLLVLVIEQELARWDGQLGQVAAVGVEDGPVHGGVQLPQLADVGGRLG